MNKLEFFLKALKSGAFKKKKWVISAFSIVREDPNGKEDIFEYNIVRRNGDYYFFDPENNLSPELLEGTVSDQPPFSFREKVKLKAGAIPNLKKDIETTYGNLLFNYMVLVWAFHDKIDYMESRVTAKMVEKIIEKRLTDEPEGGAPKPGEQGWVGGPSAPIYVSEYLRFCEAMFSLVGYTQLCVPAASPKSLTTHPDMAKLKAKLLEEYKDRLHDPAVIAKIDAELVALDKKWIEGDISEGFFSDKSFEVKRKKALLMHGAETGFKRGSEVDLITNSLAEGWDVTKMPAMINSLREGSYNRGALTALGGEAVKFYMRVFQNTKIAEEDCGSTLGRKKEITERNYKNYVGFYRITSSGKSERLTEENLQKIIGTTIIMRSPMFCKTSAASFCARCMGDKNAESPKALVALASSVGSQFMGMFMAAMHGKSLQTAKYDFKSMIR